MIKAQVHGKFKVFIPESAIPQDTAQRRLSGMVEAFTRDGKVAAKSVGIEYLESQKQLVLSLGYRDDEPGYPCKLHFVPIGKPRLFPDAIEKAMEKAAESVANVICHEFFVLEDGEFVMTLLTHEPAL
jgi:hypothetical protein